MPRHMMTVLRSLRTNRAQRFLKLRKGVRTRLSGAESKFCRQDTCGLPGNWGMSREANAEWDSVW